MPVNVVVRPPSKRLSVDALAVEVLALAAVVKQQLGVTGFRRARLLVQD